MFKICVGQPDDQEGSQPTMRLALAAVLVGCRADNATNPRPNATALLEAATKLRAEAAALETQAQAETVAPTPAPTATTRRPR